MRPTKQHDLSIDRALEQKLLSHRRVSGMLAEYDQAQLRPAASCIVSIRSPTRFTVPLTELVVFTYCPCCQNIAWYECLSLGHGLEEIGNAEDQIVGGRILT